ncbi:MAG TPA: Crp/Fnr family transcriptional regulator [Bacteroidales bacterium]|jgi:CRP/FNR family transcriptional regulator|nr:Crp/Fnr family transcriptional regulator [Bacteroidales bacterium]
MIWHADNRKKTDGNIIKNVPFFSSLSPEEIEQVEHLIIKKRYSKDQIVLFEEDTTRYMYLVYSGKVRVVKLSEEGREQIITIHKKNDFFGEMSLLDGKTAPATVIAHEEAVIGLLSKTDFERHLLSNDEIRSKIIELLCSRLRDSWAMIKILSFDNAEHRIMAVLDRLQELYGVVDDRGVIINMKLTHQQIASYASVARETVTRILNRLEKEMVIQVLDGKSILLNKSFNNKFRGVA